MESTQKSYLKEFFLYALAIGTLYFSVGNLIFLYFEYIDKLLPDSLHNYYYSPDESGIRFAMATLIILFPVYIGTTWLLRKDVIAHPEHKDIRARKFFVYLTLFLSAVAMIVDLVTLIYNFFEGELSLAFFLKVLTVLVIMGAVFAYYFWDMNRETHPDSKPSKIVGWVASVFVLVSIIAGFFVIGSPFTQRMRRLDQMRVQDLSSLQSSIIYSYWMPKGKLPASVQEVKKVVAWSNDPETNEPYSYRTLSNTSFELCANFSLPSEEKEYQQSPVNENWAHKEGKTCFKRVIDPELYPPNKISSVPGYPAANL